MKTRYNLKEKIMAAKEFKQDETAMLVTSLQMYKNSYQRRVNSETEQDSKNVWLKKIDAADALEKKIRLT